MHGFRHGGKPLMACCNVNGGRQAWTAGGTKGVYPLGWAMAEVGGLPVADVVLASVHPNVGQMAGTG